MYDYAAFEYYELSCFATLLPLLLAGMCVYLRSVELIT